MSSAWTYYLDFVVCISHSFFAICPVFGPGPNQISGWAELGWVGLGFH